MNKFQFIFILFFVWLSSLSIYADDTQDSSRNNDIISSTDTINSATIYPTATASSTTNSIASSSTPILHEHSHEFLCKVCGKTLFESSDHITGTVLNGPRVMDVYHEPELGPRGTIHTMLRSHTAGMIDVAVFRDSLPTLLPNTPVLKLVGPSENPVFPGYVQHQIICGRCGQPIGWKFDHTSITGTTSTTTTSATSTSPNTASTTSTTTTTTTTTSTSSTIYHVIPYVEGEENTRLISLEDNCYTLPRGWWTYEVCTKRKVRQFHRETDGKISPDWSLGDYDAQGKIERVRPISPVTGYYSSHFYTNGQRCDETGKGRATEVQYFCCPNTAHVSLAAPYIEDIEEPSLCRYRIKLCVPSLCIPVGATPSPVSQPDSAISEKDATITEAENTPTTSTIDEKESKSIEEDKMVSSMEKETVTIGNSDTESTVPPITTSTASDSLFVPEPPSKTYAPQSLPKSFMIASWNTLIGDKSTTYTNLQNDNLVTGIAPVRFQ